MMWWAIWCAVVVAGSMGTHAAPSTNAVPSAIDWAQLESFAPDDDSLGYVIPSMGGRSAAGSPRLYLLAEFPRDSQVSSDDNLVRSRRDFHVSLYPTFELLEKEAYEKMQGKQAKANREYLNCIGKRGDSDSESNRYCKR